MPELLASLDAFLQEHRRGGDLDAGVEPALVWMACDCAAELVRSLDEPPLWADCADCSLSYEPSQRRREP